MSEQLAETQKRVARLEWAVQLLLEWRRHTAMEHGDPPERWQEAADAVEEAIREDAES